MKKQDRIRKQYFKGARNELDFALLFLRILKIIWGIFLRMVYSSNIFI